MLLSIHPQNPQESKILEVVRCLQNGGVIIYPTDTIYALGCDIRNFKAVERICKIKDIRIDKHFFSLVCNDLSDLSKFSKPIVTPYFKILKSYLPGPYTFILQAHTDLPKSFKHRKTVGVRVPGNKITQSIVNALAYPICATSIHDTDQLIEYTTDPELIYERYRHLVDMVIDGGYGDIYPTSIIDLSNETPMLIRAGKGVVDFL